MLFQGPGFSTSRLKGPTFKIKMKGRINEIFESIQGEGLYLGEKQLFVRFAGCNLSCSFCDTNHQKFREYESFELFEEIQRRKNGHHSVSFTGGEPLLQKDFLKEVLILNRSNRYRNYLETNGTLADALEEIIDLVDIIAMDLKLPSSTGLNGCWQEHRRFLEIAYHKEVFIKSVICNSTTEEDFRLALGLINDHGKSVLLILQPNSREDQNILKEKLDKFKGIAKEENVAVCVIPQMHKIVGVK